MPNIHPLIVHFPIALLTISVLLEMIGRVRKQADLSRAGWWTQLAGTIGLIAAVLTGLVAKDGLRLASGGGAYLDTHQELAFFNSVLFTVLLLWRVASRTRLPSSNQAWYFIIFVAGVASLWIAAWVGGELVYRFGTGVLPQPL